jgi:hypothetical protein
LALKHRARRPSGLTSTMTFSPSTPCAPVLSVPLCENDGAMMHDNVGHWNGWREAVVGSRVAEGSLTPPPSQNRT